MKRIIVACGLMPIAATAALAGNTLNLGVPEMDGGFALVAGAIVMGVAAIVYEKFFRR